MVKKIELYQILRKSDSGKYVATLSDNSVDRDNEIVGEAALTKYAQHSKYLPALLDHENKVLNTVAKWTNVRVEKNNGHVALVAEPKFFMSNPNAAIIKGMLDEGAELGISIGAIVNETEEVNIENKSYTQYTDIEIIEASFVGVPSNRHGMAMAALAKSFGGKKMSEDMIKKVDFEKKVEELTEISKKHEDLEKSHADLTKTLEDKEAELVKSQEETADLKKEAEKAKADSDKEKDDKEDDDKKKDEEKKSVEAELTKTKEELETLKKSPVFKANFGEAADEAADIEKAYESGALPVIGTLGGRK